MTGVFHRPGRFNTKEFGVRPSTQSRTQPAGQPAAFNVAWLGSSATQQANQRNQPLDLSLSSQVHNFNNWLVDRVLGTSNWDPGARSTGDIVNDNEVLLDKRAGDSELTANMVGTKSGGAKT